MIIALGTLAGLILILLTAVNPAGTALGFVLSTIAMSLVLLCYLWLDRWEPEPPRLLVLAFLGSLDRHRRLWCLEATSSLRSTPGRRRPAVTVAVVAPVVERRPGACSADHDDRFMSPATTELRSLTAWCGRGWRWASRVGRTSSTVADGETPGQLTQMHPPQMRLIMGLFAHPLFTTFTGVGVALQQRNTLAKVGYVVLGYLAAVVMHGLWNGSALVGVQAYFGVCRMDDADLRPGPSPWRWAAGRQRIVAEKLPGMVAAGLVTPRRPAGWARSAPAKQAVAAVRHSGRRAAGVAVQKFAAQVIELAFVRDRIDRGFGDERCSRCRPRRHTACTRRLRRRSLGCSGWPATGATTAPRLAGPTREAFQPVPDLPYLRGHDPAHPGSTRRSQSSLPPVTRWSAFVGASTIRHRRSLAVLTGIGGNLLRDIPAGRVPAASLQHWAPITVCFVAALMTTVFARLVIQAQSTGSRSRRHRDGFFATTGAAYPMGSRCELLRGRALGMVSRASRLTIMRDIVARRFPMVMGPDDHVRGTRDAGRHRLCRYRPIGSQSWGVAGGSMVGDVVCGLPGNHDPLATANRPP